MIQIHPLVTKGYLSGNIFLKMNHMNRLKRMEIGVWGWEGRTYTKACQIQEIEINLLSLKHSKG